MSGVTLVRLGALGDVVLVSSVTPQLKGPVTLVTDPRWVPLARRFPGVSNVMGWDRDEPARVFCQRLPDGPRVDLQDNRRSRALRRASGGAWRVIDKRSVRRRMRLWWGIGSPRPTVPQLYGEACGVHPARLPWLPGKQGGPERLVVVPGAAWAPKRWAEERFHQLLVRWPGPKTVLGGPGEEAFCERVAYGTSADVVVESGFEATLRVLERAAVVVSGDSGLMHLAGALGVPVVALFGPTHPDDGFWVYPGTVLQRTLSCRPCTLHRRASCPLGHGACMDIPTEQVWEAIAGWSPNAAG